MTSNPQQSAIGISLSAGSAAAGSDGAATVVMGLIGAIGSGIVLNGWVFFICTDPAGLAGGSGRTVILAVSFFGEGPGGRIGAAGGGVIGANLGATGAGVCAGAAEGEALALNSGGGVTGFAGAGGKGAEAMGGRAAAPGPGAGGLIGPGLGGGGAPFPGGRGGIFIRTVSRLGA